MRAGVALIGTLAVVLGGLGGVAGAQTGSGGGEIAYSAPGQRVMVSDADGQHPRMVGHGAVAAISPDGTTIAVVRDEGLHTPLFLLKVGTGTLTLLTKGVTGPVRWSPDSDRLLVEQFHPRGLWLLLCTRAPVGCRTLDRNAGTGFAFSPDGSSIAYDTYGPPGRFAPASLILSPGAPARRVPGTDDVVSLWTPAGLIYTHVPNGHPQRLSLWAPDGVVRTLWTGRPSMPWLVPEDVSPDGSTILYEAVVGCGPVVPSTPAPGPSACLAYDDLLETAPIAGGVPQPLTDRPSVIGSEHFNAAGTAIVAAFVARRAAYLGLLALPAPAGGRSPAEPHLLWRLAPGSSPSVAR